MVTCLSACGWSWGGEIFPPKGLSIYMQKLRKNAINRDDFLKRSEQIVQNGFEYLDGNFFPTEPRRSGRNYLLVLGHVCICLWLRERPECSADLRQCFQHEEVC